MNIRFIHITACISFQLLGDIISRRENVNNSYGHTHVSDFFFFLSCVVSATLTIRQHAKREPPKVIGTRAKMKFCFSGRTAQVSDKLHTQA